MKKRVRTFFGAMLLALTLGGAVYVLTHSQESFEAHAFEQKAPDMEKSISVLP
ncbi:MAG: hypothetical protein AAF587_38040 [Bacteroidota bacterium]